MVLVPGGRPSGTLAVPVGHRAAVMSAGTWQACVHSGMGAMGSTRVWESLAPVGGGGVRRTVTPGRRKPETGSGEHPH